MNEGKIKAKAIQLDDNDIICPSCNSILTISEDIINNEFIQCGKCDTVIPNPFDNRKIIYCTHCGEDFVVPENKENEEMVNCTVCGAYLYNFYSDKYIPAQCPHCMFEAHIPEHLRLERYLSCPNCFEGFRNPLYS